MAATHCIKMKALLLSFVVILLLCLPRGWADEALACRYQNAGCAVVMCSDADLSRFVLSTEEANKLLFKDAEGERELQVEAWAYVLSVMPWGDAGMLLSGNGADDKARLMLYHDGSLQDVTPTDLPAWCVPICRVQRGEKSYLLAQGADVPQSDAPLLLIDVEHGVCSSALSEVGVAYSIRADGRIVALLRWAADGSKSVYALGENGAQPVLTVGCADRLQLFGSAGNHAVYVMHDVAREGACLAALDLKTRALQTVAEAGRADVTLPFFSPSGELVGYCSRWDKEHYTVVRPCSVIEALQQALPSDASFVPLKLSADVQRVLIHYSPAGQPARPAVYELGVGLRELATPQNVPPTRPTHFGEYPAADGTRIPCYYTLPAGDGPHPTVIFVHGGPRMRTDSLYDWRVQYLVSQGFAVVQPQFRGSRGWGKSYMHAGNRQWGRGVLQTDVNDCIPWLVEKGIAAPGRIAIFGGSYGGYAATAALCFYPGMYACGISLFGPQDLELYLQKMNGMEAPYAGEDAMLVGEADTPEGRAALRRLSPVYHAADVTEPLLIYYGEQDTLIPPEHSKRMIEALRAAGKPVQAVSLADEAHGFADPAHEPWLYACLIVPFLNQHLNNHEHKTD